MTKSSINPKVSHRVFAIFLAIILSITCLSSTKVAAATSTTSDFQLSAEPVVAAYNNNYVHYYAFSAKLREQMGYGYSFARVVKTFLQYCDVDYTMSGDEWGEFTVFLPDFCCKVHYGSVYLIDRHHRNDVTIQEVKSWTYKIYSNYEGAIETKCFQDDIRGLGIKVNDVGSGAAGWAYDSDVAMVLTAISAYYSPKIEFMSQGSPIRNHADLANYLSDYITKHSRDAANIREEIISIAKTKNGKVAEEDFRQFYASRYIPEESYYYTNRFYIHGLKDYSDGYGFTINHNNYTWWSIVSDADFDFLYDYPFVPEFTVYRTGDIAQDADEFMVEVWRWLPSGAPSITANYTDKDKIEIRCGNEVIRTINCCKPSDRIELDIEVCTRRFSNFYMYIDGLYTHVDTDTLTLGIMIDRALYELARAEGLC